MKTLFFILMLQIGFVFSQDSTAIEPYPPEADTLHVHFNSPAQKLQLDDYKKFYIGFTTTEKMLEVLTLNIEDIAAGDSSLTFQYTLNTQYNREEGTGNIWPQRSIIRFQNQREGRISLPEDGKIVFESLTQDSLNYWKLKEK